MQCETAEVNETPLGQIKENKMKHLLTLTLFLGIVWGQGAKATGLELSDISDFDVLCEQLNEAGKKIGLNQESIKAKVKLTLRGNGTPSKGNDISPYLYINIFVREDKTKSGNILGHAVNITMEFRRFVSYDTYSPPSFEKKVWGKYAGTWFLPDWHLTISRDDPLRPKIMGNLLEMVDQFSIALLEANEK